MLCGELVCCHIGFVRLDVCCSGLTTKNKLTVDRSAVMRLKLLQVMKSEEELKEYDDVF